jgi:mRNA-degrading endonuclease toxin of MazEF toxin-antitoxin module
MTYQHGHVVSIPDPHGRRSSRPAVIISDRDCPDHGSLYTVAAVTGSKRYGQTRYAVEIAKDEPETGELLKRSYIEPWASEQIAHDDVRDVHARLGRATMKRLAKSFAEMILR